MRDGETWTWTLEFPILISTGSHQCLGRAGFEEMGGVECCFI